MKARRKPKIEGGRKRQLVEEALRESESLYRQLISGVPVASYITDEQGFLTLWNEAAEGLWGRIPTAGQDRWCGSWRLYTADGSFLPHEECPMAVAITERRAISGVEALGEKPDGTRFSFLANASPLYDASGAFKGAMNVMMDITERKQVEKALRESESKYRLLFENMQEGFSLHEIILDENGKPVDFRFLDANEAYERHTGVKRQDAIGRTILQILPQVDPRQIENYGKVALTGEPQISEYYSEAFGRYFHIRAFSPQRGRFATIFEDITERKQAESRLQLSEERLKYALEGANDGLWDWNVQTGAAYFSPRWKAMIGCAEDELPNHYETWDARLHPDDKPRVLQVLQAHFADAAREYAPEFRMLTKAGEWIWVQARGRVVERDRESRPLRMVGTHTDITARKLAEKALRESEERFRSLSEAAFEGILIHDQGVILNANQAFADLLSYRSPEDLIGKQGLDTIPFAPESRELIRANLRSGSTAPLEIMVMRPDGSMFPAETQGRDITFNGRKLRVVAMRDITVRRKAEMELRESANKILAIFSAIGDGITVADLQGRILESNHAAFRLHGFENKEEFLDIDIAQLVAGTDRERMLHDGRTIMQSGGAGVFEYTLRRNDGSLFDGELRLTRLDNAQKGSPGIIAVTRDISRRKRAEEALRNSEGRLRQAMYVAQLGIWDWDITTDKTTWQGQMFNIYGVSPEQFTGNGADYIAFTREDYRHAQAENISFAFEHGVTEEQLLSGIDIPLDSKELCIVQSDGTEVYTLGNAIAILDEKGIATRMLGVTMDITARKRAEQALQEAEARYRMLVEQMPTVMYVDAPDEAGTATYVSPQVETMLGYPLAEWEQDSYFWHKHIHPDDYEHAARIIPTVLAHGRADAEYRMLARDGQAVWVRDECVLIRDAAGRPFFVQGFLVDVTERKRAEEERRQLEARMQQAQKLESLGILAGGIAHDFNNLLTSMLGYASLALMELPAESVACPMLREIELAARRAADLTQQLLAYSGRSKFVIQVLQLDMLVQEMAKLLGTVVSKKATLRLDLAPAAIEADATQIRQIVMNLITNASDALEGQPGVITVRTGVRYADAALLHSPYLQEALPAGDYAYVEVEDNGCGMTEDTLARIFDPFFTTKFTGRGLGLAAVLGIAKGHKGTIKVISAVGQGTVFQAFFPCVRAAAGEAARVDPRRAAVQGHGTVLVVEDEDMVRSFTRRVLESAGFQVREAADGRAGLELFGQHVRDIVAVVLDLTMPRMDGREVLQHMRHLAPNVPVLVMSGYSDLEISARFAGLGASGFIQKPFHPRDLIALVSRMVS